MQFLASGLISLGVALQEAATESWEPLAAEYEAAMEAWVSAPGDVTFESLVEPFAPRFATLAAGGDARADLWFLSSGDQGSPRDLAQRAEVFQRLRQRGAGEWDSALTLLLARTDPAPEGFDAWLIALDGEPLPAPRRAVALLARAHRASEGQHERRMDLATRAAFLRWLDVDLGAGETVLAEDAQELALTVLEDLEEAHDIWWKTCFRQSADGVFLSRAAFFQDPRESWRPAIEALAQHGGSAAQAWMLLETWPRDEAQRARQRDYLEALAHTTLPPKTLKSLGSRVDSLMQTLGADFVEPRVLELLDQIPDAQRSEILFRLGVGLCENATSDEGHRRGLALLAEVKERWPTSFAGRRVDGQLFRFQNLRLGQAVPDFETVDVDGNAFRLSDYRGKITVLDFWGFW